MKREIKFRGKRLDKGKWEYGSLVIINGRYFIINEEWRGEVDPSTVGQYTGLKDNNGREIYEGDVLRMYDNKRYTFTCIYLQTQSAFLGRCNETRFGLANITEGVSKEIIGNIHDNPELLKAE